MEEAVYSLGCGDRFGQQGVAQLRAFREAMSLGLDIVPVWNKSKREHLTLQTEPGSVRAEADTAVQALGWARPYYVDADHITLATVDGFIESSDFFTLDVAHVIGKAADQECMDAFIDSMQAYTGDIHLPGIEKPLFVTAAQLRASAEKYLFAVQEAGRIYRHIAQQKREPFLVEVSMDETAEHQTPGELLFILAMIAQENLPLDTIAPKFSGCFNKGVDYVGDVLQFEHEFERDVAAVAFAVKEFGLQKRLRLSVHSGSDKFAIYPAMNRVIKKFSAGLHVKTAGTTWLEEVIGLAEAGGTGLTVAKKIYAGALNRYDELSAPYASVIDIYPDQLPSLEAVNGWTSEAFVAALRHDPSCPAYNPSFRQQMHVAYKVAFELGAEYRQALEDHAAVVGRNVTENLLERHLKPIFG